jgi:hypothetical protein
MRATRVRSAVAVLATLAATSCGYGFAGHGRSFESDIRTIGVEAFTNVTREHGVEKRLALAIEREFTIRGPLRVAPVPAEGDLVLTGSVRSVFDRPVAFNQDDEVLIYQTLLALDLQLRRRTTGELVWEARDLRHVEDYASVASVIVTSSADFRGSTLDARDLGDFTDIQLAESRRRRALDRLVSELARDVYDQIMEDF